MTILAGLPVLRLAEMRAAEERAVAAGTSVTMLMERAGTGVAQWTARLASGAAVLVLCGPGNNGGDGYVAARVMQAAGLDVRVAALSPPATEAAIHAAAGWTGPVLTVTAAQRTPVVVDAVFGTGVNRPVDGAEALAALIDAARLSIAVDLPSGLDTDRGEPHGQVSACDMTLALGALKPAHVLQPGADLCGTVRLVDIGIVVDTPVVQVLMRPSQPEPGADAHKYRRGKVLVMAGAMPGAARLAAIATLRAGAGYVALLDDHEPGGPAALVRHAFSAAELADPKANVVVVGPGLGRDARAKERLAMALAYPGWRVIDGDALRLIDPDHVPGQSVLTPHSGEFDALFGTGGGSKLDRTLAAAARAGAVVVHKGADTVIAGPDGHAVIAPGGSGWLATAGTGDVLAGAIAARMAEFGGSFASVCAGVWTHARAAQLLGGGFIADDLAAALGRVRAGA